MHRLSIFVILAMASALHSANATESTLMALGDLDRLTIGQAGYCGDRKELGASEWQRVSLSGDQQVWFYALSTYRTPARRFRCNIEKTFTPVSGKAYILRVTHTPDTCRVELFRVVPGADPVRERLLNPESRSCLAP